MGWKLAETCKEPDTGFSSDLPDERELINRVTTAGMLPGTREDYKRYGGLPLFPLLGRVMYFQATDPRDKIYGIRGMLPRSTQERLPIDYNKPAELIYTEATAFMLSTENFEMDLYRLVSLRGISSEQQPSWVPDYSSQKNYSPSSPIHLGPGIPGATASGDIKMSRVKVSDDSKTLLVEGIFLDVIDDLRLLSDKEAMYLQELVELIEPAALQASHLQIEPTDRIYPFRSLRHKEPVWRTVVANKNFVRQGGPAPLEFENMFEVVAGRAEVPEDFMPLGARQARRGAYTSTFREQLKFVLPGRTAFITNTGFWGFGVPGIQTGDAVTALFGHSIPMVIRRHGNFQTFVGGAYVSGIMEGELVNEYYKKGLVESLLFTIC